MSDETLSRRARDMARNIQGNLGRCLYRRKDVAEMEEVSETLMELADELSAKLGSGTCGENYVKQGTLGNGTLTAEQVRETVEKHWHDLPDEYDMPEATALPEYSYDWQAIADELSAELGSEINGETSDGYHTFNELYHHRAVLFSVIVRDHRELAWKARKHHDGTMYEGMFIVGVETPDGQATYHYDLDPYWDMFDCEEREFAPEWDGHTPDDAIARIAELGSGTCENTQHDADFMCSVCGKCVDNGRILGFNYCPNCGAKVVS